MDEALRVTVARVLVQAPCSVELPAGTGKTHLLAATAAVAGHQGNRSLILTHTNAGVDAIRRRLRSFRVPSKLVRVETITSWAFSLDRAYSGIAGVTVPDVPDWANSTEYVHGAVQVAQAQAIQQMLSASYDYLFVDEYQDCTVAQHEFVLGLARAIPRTVILGDPLQAIFGFAGTLAGWSSHVLPSFPALDKLEHTPHRWSGHNPALGQWLLDIRPLLTSGCQFDFSTHKVQGLRWVRSSQVALVNAARGFRDPNESVVVLDTFPNFITAHAGRIGGGYTVMEEVEGKFMKAWLTRLPAEGDPLLAHWLAEFTKACSIGHAGINRQLLGHLQRGHTVAHLRRDGLDDVLVSIDEVVGNPTYEQLGRSAALIRRSAALRFCRREAWRDTFSALATSQEGGDTPIESLATVRDRLRHRGRGTTTRVISRPVLVKGLEYDHVVIADAARMRDPRTLYVALSRARKSVTVIGGNPIVRLQDDNPRPIASGERGVRRSSGGHQR